MGGPNKLQQIKMALGRIVETVILPYLSNITYWHEIRHDDAHWP